MLRASVFCIASAILFAQTKPDTNVAIEAVVQKQVEAYNAHDIEAFVSFYAADAQTIEFSTGQIYDKSNADIKIAYLELFKKFPNLKCKIKNRIIQGNYVIDQELITGTNVSEASATAIYYVKNGKISKVWFL